MRVLDLSDIRASYCGKQLAAMGADVVKIEKPGGDDARRCGPFDNRAESKESSLSFAYYNTGKRSVTLDIFSEEGKSVFLRLIKEADVLIETFDVGVMGGYGLGYEQLSAVNPKLIMLSVSPFGQTGEHSKWKAATDLIPGAMSGLMATVGYRDKPPLHLGYDIQAAACSMYGLFGIQCAYHQRLKSGKGAYIDISQQECMSLWTSQGLGIPQVLGHDVERRVSDKHSGGVRQGLVNCRDGLCFLTIACKWRQLTDWFKEKGVYDPAFGDARYDAYAQEVLTLWDRPLCDALNRLGAQYNKKEFMEEGQRRKIPVGMVDTPSGMLDNIQLKARNFFVEIEHPAIGSCKYPGAPVIMSDCKLSVDKPAPLLGADTDSVLKGLGYSAEEIMAFRERRIV